VLRGGRSEARLHQLRQHADLRAIAPCDLDNDIAARAAVEKVVAGAADQYVISGPAQQIIVAWAADEDVSAVAAVRRELNAAKPRRIDDVVAPEAIEDKAVVCRFGARDCHSLRETGDRDHTAAAAD
jgi:hypothetical protein